MLDLLLLTYGYGIRGNIDRLVTQILVMGQRLGRGATATAFLGVDFNFSHGAKFHLLMVTLAPMWDR